MSIEAMKLAAEFNRYFTSGNGVDVPERVSVSRDEWRQLHAALQSEQPDSPWTENVAVKLAASRTGRAYIAGPMTGIAEFNFPAFNKEAVRLRVEGLTVLNPADHGIVEGAEWADYLRHDIAGLATCQRIHLLPGWEKSKGARLEVTIAQTLGMAITLSDGAASPASTSAQAEAEAQQPATPEPVVSRNPFASRCYTMSESHLSGHRLIVGFEKLGDAQDAHEWVARQGRGDFTHPAPSVPADMVRDAERYRFIRDADVSDDLIPDIALYAMESLDEYIDAAMLAAKEAK